MARGAALIVEDALSHPESYRSNSSITESTMRAGIHCVWTALGILELTSGIAAAGAQWPDWLPPVERSARGSQNGEGWGGWVTGPGCQTRRIEVLRQTSQQQATVSKDGCDVTSGLWYDAYTGNPIHDPRDVVVDHIIDPREADESGAWRWLPARRKAFFNDTHNLAIVSQQQSREKHGRDPGQWLPADAGVKCDYVVRWVELKRTYGLTVDHAEARKLVSVVEECVEQRQR